MTIEFQSDSIRLKPKTAMKSNQERLNKHDNVITGWWSVFVEMRDKIRLGVMKLKGKVKDWKLHLTDKNPYKTKIGN